MSTQASSSPGDFTTQRKEVLEKLDSAPISSWHIRVCLVASAGLFADGYSLYAVLFILPMLAYVYPATESFGVMLKTCTWFGSLFGHLLFGYMTDRYGRRKVRIMNININM